VRTLPCPAEMLPRRMTTHCYATSLWISTRINFTSSDMVMGCRRSRGRTAASAPPRLLCLSLAEVCPLRKVSTLCTRRGGLSTSDSHLPMLTVPLPCRTAIHAGKF
jgi:hypothetical protein